ncbi:nickel pincer cofactor biosynthesis protein LarC [bacterium]|nr:nickel pincer cofactor biosynthesis protein LarC [bacterium]MBU1754619.1 nickel pincer cofactor biosynthesis protein LarC [bacterium]
MRIIYFDCFSGISGDMILGALIDAGVDIQWLNQELSKMDITYSLKTTRVTKGGLQGLRALVGVDKERLAPTRMFEIINKSSLSEKIKAVSCQIIERLVQAEAFVHNIPSDRVHFHELGDKDTLVDVVGAVICIDKLGVEKIYSSALNLGSGSVSCEHGILPVPAPATAELIKNFPVYSVPGTDRELTTPTGAAIITTLGLCVEHLPQMQVQWIGYGAGGHETTIPNLLRVFVGEAADKKDENEMNIYEQDIATHAETRRREENRAAFPDIYEHDAVTLLETNIDDMNPEIHDYLIEELMKQGAIDVWLIPIHGKKGRIGILLSVISHHEDVDRLVSLIFSQTTTIGIRIHPVARKKLPRQSVEIHTKYGILKAKETAIGDKRRVIPEYEECRRIAVKENVPLQEVYWECMRG